MKAKLGNEIVEYWQISLTKPANESWSKFQKNHQVLLGGTLQVVQRLEYVLD